MDFLAEMTRVALSEPLSFDSTPRGHTNSCRISAEEPPARLASLAGDDYGEDGGEGGRSQGLLERGAVGGWLSAHADSGLDFVSA